MNSIASGSCGCVGLVGAALGGGIGKTQGQFGLMLDNILDVTVVLANGDVVVASEKSHSDLFWGLRGAGHNFGVVNELTYRTHELFPADGHWYVATLWFSNNKLEDVLEICNQFTGPGSDVGLTLTMQIGFNPDLSETEVSRVPEQLL
jgi:FAD/FMN-containing dehydrogenase